MDKQQAVWRNQAVQWDHVGPPLRPSAPDLAFQKRQMEAAVATHAAPRALLLGVTPELTRLGWPDRTTLFAIDHCAAMIKNVWPGFPARGQGAVHANWLALPFADAAQDLIVSDGCFGVLRHPDEHLRLLSEVRRVLRAGGRFVFRVFVQPEPAEDAAAVYDALLSGRIGSFHAFKLRLLMALQRETRAGVTTGDVFAAFSADGPPPALIAERLHWPVAQIATIEAYRNQETTYYFPRLAELRASIAASGFIERSSSWPEYELGERCPTLCLEQAG